MAGLWTIVVPEAGTNLVLNPSAELAGNFLNLGGGCTVTRDTTYARFGAYSYRIPSGGANCGVNLTLTTLANAIHYVTFYARGNAANTLQVSLDSGGNYNAVSIIGGSTGGWVRYGVSIIAAQANGSTSCIIRNTTNETYYFDGIQVEQQSYYTTYIDGDMGSLYRWSGLRHGSTSTRDAQERGGGRERDFDTDYGIQIEDSSNRFGVPAIQQNILGQALQPGAVFQSTKIQPREMVLVAKLTGTSMPTLHAKRQDLWDLLKPDRVRGAQPFIIGYSGAVSARKVYGWFRYSAGLEFANPMGYTEHPPVRLLAVDPFWYEDSQDTFALDFQDSVSSSAYANRRTNGQWLALGSGMQAEVRCIAVDYQRGRVYFGGTFTTANGVTVNGICYWNGTTFVAMDAGVGAGAGSLLVADITIAANGDVWIGGEFRTVGSGVAACKGLARWNISSSTWTAFNNTTGTFLSVQSIAIDSSGNIYIGGEFTNWDNIAAADYIAKYNGSTWSALGTSPFTATVFPHNAQALAIDANNNLWTGETQWAGPGTTSVRKWNGSSWTTVVTTNSVLTGEGIKAILFSPNGNLYIAGFYSTIGGVSASNISVYNGTSISPLGSGLNAIAYSLLYLNGIIYAGGEFTSAGGLSLADRLAVWNGYVWYQPDIDLPGTPFVYTIASYQGDLFIGYSTTGTALAAGLTTVTQTGTAENFPVITLIGPSSASCTLQWLENQSTGHRLYFNLIVYSGETVTIDLRQGRKRITSDWRGVITDQPLSNSDFAWHLLGAPASNIIAAFITGTITAAVLVANVQPRHSSVDGPA